MPNQTQWSAAGARRKLNASLRRTFDALGFEEVETPALVPTPGQEPHINPFETSFVPELGQGRARTLYLHTSPEYAMKRLLADGSGPLFQVCKVFRNGEASAHHNPEFTLLEFYRPGADYRAIMTDLERLLSEAELAVTGTAGRFSRVPYERLTVAEAVRRETGIDLFQHRDGVALRAAAEARGTRLSPGSRSFEDVFFSSSCSRSSRSWGTSGRPTCASTPPRWRRWRG